jgi:hypothetical protein
VHCANLTRWFSTGGGSATTATTTTCDRTGWEGKRNQRWVGTYFGRVVNKQIVKGTIVWCVLGHVSGYLALANSLNGRRIAKFAFGRSGHHRLPSWRRSRSGQLVFIQREQAMGRPGRPGPCSLLHGQPWRVVPRSVAGCGRSRRAGADLLSAAMRGDEPGRLTQRSRDIGLGEPMTNKSMGRSRAKSIRIAKFWYVQKARR